MAAIKIRWHVDELANVLTLFNTQKVYRSTAGPSGPWAEITGPGTRVPLAPGVADYLYDDTGGDPAYYYAVAYYNSATTLESGLSEPMRGELSGYCTIQDVRDEGFAATAYPDAQVIRGIALASALIERVTHQWFEPRNRTFTLDGRRAFDLHPNAPIIAVSSVTMWDEAIDLADLLIYNRHLTEGLYSPDDRANPRIAWRDENAYPYGYTYGSATYGRFAEGRRNVRIAGVFGYTELEPTDPVGETAPGSQVPLCYGSTPALVRRACLLLTCRRFMRQEAAGDALGSYLAGRVSGESTRDQSYSLGAPVGEDGAYGMTGDLEVDNLLAPFAVPLHMGIV